MDNTLFTHATQDVAITTQSVLTDIAHVDTVILPTRGGKREGAGRKKTCPELKSHEDRRLNPQGKDWYDFRPIPKARARGGNMRSPRYTPTEHAIDSAPRISWAMQSDIAPYDILTGNLPVRSQKRFRKEQKKHIENREKHRQETPDYPVYAPMIPELTGIASIDRAILRETREGIERWIASDDSLFHSTAAWDCITDLSIDSCNAHDDYVIADITPLHYIDSRYRGMIGGLAYRWSQRQEGSDYDYKQDIYRSACILALQHVTAWLSCNGVSLSTMYPYTKGSGENAIEGESPLPPIAFRILCNLSAKYARQELNRYSSKKPDYLQETPLPLEEHAVIAQDSDFRLLVSREYLEGLCDRAGATKGETTALLGLYDTGLSLQDYADSVGKQASNTCRDYKSACKKIQEYMGSL